MLTITLGNFKGGTGKTTSTVHIGHGLALAGYKVLIVDVDPQGHCAPCLGMPKGDGLYRLLREHDPEALDNAALEPRPNLHLVAGDKSTARLKTELTSRMLGRERVLADALSNAPYDVTLIDTPPSLDLLQINALMASSWAIIPTKLDFLAMDGVNELLRSIAEINKYHPIAGTRIIPTFYDRQTRETAQQFGELLEHLGPLVWPPIPQDTRLREAAAYGQTLYEFAPDSRGLRGYREHERRIGGYAEIVNRIKELLK